MEGNNEDLFYEENFQSNFGEEGFNLENDSYNDINEEENSEYDGRDYNGPDINSPDPKPFGGIYALFDAVRRTPRTTKVSNLNKFELGELGISVRESMRIALLGKTFHHPIFAKFFLDQAGIISDSAMSKNGWFTELFVTSKKYASRESSSKSDNIPTFEKGKWKMFSGKNKN